MSYEEFMTSGALVAFIIAAIVVVVLIIDGVRSFKRWKARRQARKNWDHKIRNNIGTVNEMRESVLGLEIHADLKEDVGLSILYGDPIHGNNQFMGSIGFEDPDETVFYKDDFGRPVRKHRWEVIDWGNGKNVAFQCRNGCDGLMVVHKVGGILVYRNLNFPCRGAH